ncbi:MAG: bacteriophage holin [Candidatus Omnitrophica bacterium]|nr:bacteriophage holin [Candidatus Omnitrophota bacterium]
MAKLNVKAFGLACGIVWGAAMLLLGLFNMFNNWGSGIEKAMATLYIGYKPTILGSTIGGLWGFADAGIGGTLVAWLYNRLQR